VNLQEEKRIRRAQFGGRRPGFTNDQRPQSGSQSPAARTRDDFRDDNQPVVTLETPLKWHRKLIASKYDGGVQRRPGRPVTQQEIEALVVRLPTGNPDWGYLANPACAVESRPSAGTDHHCWHP
jgi:hypothetical protein